VSRPLAERGRSIKTPTILNRRSLRLKGYNYAQPGAYFVTICVRDRECLLGKVVDDKMVLNDAGRIVAESLAWLADRYPCVALDESIVMPNHLHGIILIEDDIRCRGGSRTAPTRSALPIARKPLGRLVGAFKTVSTRRINALRERPGSRFWQRNYYEHVIDGDDEMNRIRDYIANNPYSWETDQDNPLYITTRR
jgi:putative transposase